MGEELPMTLLDAKPPEPPRKIGRYFLIVLGVLIVGVVAYVLFRDYPEERVVSRFLTTLEEGKFQEAYNLWQPAKSYTYNDFLNNWGIQGDYGKVRSFKILGSRSKGSNTVIVTITVNDVEPPIDLLVDRKTKGLAFSPF
jgi:hypothetical protein